MIDLRDFDIDHLEFTETVDNYLDSNLELRQGLTRLLNFIRIKQDLKEYNAQIPIVLSTKSGSWIRAELVGIDSDEVMTSEGKGSFMVHKIHQLNGIYPPLVAV